MRNKQRVSQAQAAQNAKAIAAARAATEVATFNTSMSPPTVGHLHRQTSKQDIQQLSSGGIQSNRLTALLQGAPQNQRTGGLSGVTRVSSISKMAAAEAAASSRSPNLIRHQRAGATVQHRSNSKSAQQPMYTRSYSDVVHLQKKHQVSEQSSTDIRYSQSSQRDQKAVKDSGIGMPEKMKLPVTITDDSAFRGESVSQLLPMRRSRVKSMQQASAQPLFGGGLMSAAQAPINAYSRKPQQPELKMMNTESVQVPNSASLSRLSNNNYLRAGFQDTSITAQQAHIIKLFVRVRPIQNSENSQQCIELGQECDPVLSSQSVKLVKGYNSISFKFDKVLDQTCSQESSFQLSSASIVKNFVAFGSSATIFAYGQTGAGKTYTIIGGASQTSNTKRKDSKSAPKKLKLSTSERKGILPHIIDNLFIPIGDPEFTSPNAQYLMSFYEIYNDKVYDLLKTPVISPQNSGSAGSKEDSQISRESLEVREQKDGNFVVHNLKKVVVKTRQESYIWLERGLQNRQISATSANAASSRSHTIFQIEKLNLDGQVNGPTSKLRIVDLAGSEKYCYSNMSQDVKMKELSSINQSLSTLGQCISALGDPQRRHIPFRNCKLTKILRDSLMQPIDLPQPTLVAVIVCISPSIDSYKETQSTLQFADRAKKAILNQAAAQQPVTKILAGDQSGSLSKLKSVLLDNMASEMEKLRKENEELKSHLRVIRQSNSQSSFRGVGVPLESSGLLSSNNAAATPILKHNQGQPELASENRSSQISASIDLRLSQAFTNKNVPLIDQSAAENKGQPTYSYRPRQESSPVPILDQSQVQEQQQEQQEVILKPYIVLRSCFKGERAHKNSTQHHKTLSCRVGFLHQLENDTSLNESIRERIEHNLKYNDDTIFDNMGIFSDIGETNNKVHGSKDKFNAKSLLSVPIWEIPVSDDDEEQDDEREEIKQQRGEQRQAEEAAHANALALKKQNEEVKLGEEQSAAEESKEQKEPSHTQPIQKPVITDIPQATTAEIINDNENNVSQLPSFNQSNIQGGVIGSNSFLPDMPSLPQIQQDTLNLSNDLSNDLIEIANDKQFQDAFTKGGSSLHKEDSLGSAIKPSLVFKEDSSPIARPTNLLKGQKILIREDEFLKFDEGSKQDESLPLSASLAFGDQPGANLSSILEQTNQQATRPNHRDAVQESMPAQVDMFRPQDKLFLNDMSNILQVEEQMTQKSLDTGAHNPNQTSGFLGGNNTIQQALDNQLQSTLILDAEDEREEIFRKQEAEKASSRQGTIDGLIQRKTSNQSSPLEDTIAGGFAMLANNSHGSDNNKRGLLQEIRDEKDGSGEQDRMISFDASRISPNHNLGLHLDTSQANMNNTMLRHLNDDGPMVSKIWPNNGSQGEFAVEGDLTNPMEENLIKPEQIEHSAPINLLSDLHTGNLFVRNNSKNMPAQDPQKALTSANILIAGEDQEKTGKVDPEEILTQSLTNTFSTIQSLGGELTALRNNLELNQKIQSKQQQQQVQQEHMRIQRHTRPLRASGYRIIDEDANGSNSAHTRDSITQITPKETKKPQVEEESKQPLFSQAVHSQIAAPTSIKQFSSAIPDRNSISAQQHPAMQQYQNFTTPQALPHDVVQARQEVTKRQYTRPFNTIGGHSSIVPGNRIEKIHESHQYDEDDDENEDENNTSEDIEQHMVSGSVMTDQSLSMDLTLFARDLQGYYSRIHSEIAQLKDILLRTQHDQQMARSAREDLLLSESDTHVFSAQELPQFAQVPIQALASTQRFTRNQNNICLPIQAKNLAKLSQSPQPWRQKKKNNMKKINKGAILRAQELIEQIKHEILGARRGGQTNSQDEDGGSACEEQDRISDPQPHRPPTYFNLTERDRDDQESCNNDDPNLLLAQASSVLTFHPVEPFTERQHEHQLMESAEEQMMSPQTHEQRNASSQNVVSLLQRLQNELLESIPGQQQRTAFTPARQQLEQPRVAQSAKKLVQKRFDLHPSQYEEIQGSQERSPYVVRHMQIQRQNWIRIEDAKAQQQHAPLQQVGLAQLLQKPTTFSDQGRIVGGSAPNDQQQKQRESYMLEQAKRSVEDADVNVTNTSAMINGEGYCKYKMIDSPLCFSIKGHVIQRPLPVNRIQKKITKDQTYGMGEEQHRAPRPSPVKQTTNIFKDMCSPDKLFGTPGIKRNKVQGPKITGIGAGSVGADHTLTLIFDSDEEMGGNDGSQPSDRYYNKVGDQKRLSEIVEDYLDDGNQTAQNDNILKQKFAEDEKNDTSQIVDFAECAVEQQPFERAVEISNHKNQQKKEQETIEEGEQHSFMQESSLHNLFSHSGNRGVGGMMHLESGFEGKSRISKRDGGSFTRFTGGVAPISDMSKPRISDFNLPIAHVPKQDMSHMSDDIDLHFWLQQQNNNHSNSLQQQFSAGNPNIASGSMLDSSHGNLQLEFAYDKLRSSATELIPSKLRDSYLGQALTSDRDLYEIKEIMESGTPDEQRRQPIPAASQQLMGATAVACEETKQAKDAPTVQATSVPKISKAQTWAPPPKLKNLRSKKRKGQQQDAAPAETMFKTSMPKVQPPQAKQAAASVGQSENLIVGQENSEAEQQHINQPVETDLRTKPGTLSRNNNFGAMAQKSVEKAIERPMMQGSGNQAQNPQLTQTLMAPLHQTSMEMQDISHYSENFDEEDYMEQSNNSSSKQSVQKYLFQFFNPSAKLHQQQQQYLASQSAFRKSNASSTATMQTSQSISSVSMMPAGLAAGIPRSSGKKSPLMHGRKTAPTYTSQSSNHPSGSKN